MNWSLLAAQVVRAVRGARTQKALSRALGYRTNVLFAWESERDAPSARKFFRLLEVTGRDPLDVLHRFGRGEFTRSPTCKEGLIEFLALTAGNRSHQQLGGALGRDRHAVGRWLRGTSDIPLPEFFHWIEATTLSVVDFIATFVDPRAVPAIAEEYERLEAARHAASRMPWSHAIVHMVDLPGYRKLGCHQPGWFASRLNISTEDERHCLELLVRMGRLTLEDGLYRSTGELAVDMRRDPKMTRRLASFWMEQGAREVLEPGAGRFAFNTFSVSRADFERLKTLQSRYFSELRSLIAESREPEMVAVATFQLFPLAGDEG